MITPPHPPLHDVAYYEIWHPMSKVLRINKEGTIQSLPFEAHERVSLHEEGNFDVKWGGKLTLKFHINEPKNKEDVLFIIRTYSHRKHKGEARIQITAELAIFYGDDGTFTRKDWLNSDTKFMQLVKFHQNWSFNVRTSYTKCNPIPYWNAKMNRIMVDIKNTYELYADESQKNAPPSISVNAFPVHSGNLNAHIYERLKGISMMTFFRLRKGDPIVTPGYYHQRLEEALSIQGHTIQDFINVMQHALSGKPEHPDEHDMMSAFIRMFTIGMASQPYYPDLTHDGNTSGDNCIIGTNNFKDCEDGTVVAYLLYYYILNTNWAGQEFMSLLQRTAHFVGKPYAICGRGKDPMTQGTNHTACHYFGAIVPFHRLKEEWPKLPRYNRSTAILETTILATPFYNRPVVCSQEKKDVYEKVKHVLYDVYHEQPLLWKNYTVLSPLSYAEHKVAHPEVIRLFWPGGSGLVTDTMNFFSSDEPLSFSKIEEPHPEEEELANQFERPVVTLLPNRQPGQDYCKCDDTLHTEKKVYKDFTEWLNVPVTTESNDRMMIYAWRLQENTKEIIMECAKVTGWKKIAMRPYGNGYAFILQI